MNRITLLLLRLREVGQSRTVFQSLFINIGDPLSFSVQWFHAVTDRK